MSVIIIVA